LFPSITKVSNSVIKGSVILGSQSAAFEGGAGIYAAARNCVVSVVATDIVSNSAGLKGSGGALFVGNEAVFSGTGLNVRFNIAGKGGGVHLDSSRATISSSSISSNFAASQGGGFFCVGLLNSTELLQKQVSKGNSTITFVNVEIFNNTLSESPTAVGASLYVYGAVQAEFDAHSRVHMRADRLLTVLEIVFSVSGGNSSSPWIASTVCMRGTMLNLASTQVENQITKLEIPTDDFQDRTNCNPACLFTPRASFYTAASGILASCIPCPAGKYSLSNSSTTNDSMSVYCLPCPFGAKCSGGNLVQNLDSYWGWKVSDTLLASEFLQVPEGYGCEGSVCEAIDSCGRNHSDVLCGGCVENFSAAFFTTDCVSDSECASWKMWLLVCGALFYCFIFSCFLRYEAEPGQSGSIPATPSSPNPFPTPAKSVNHTGNEIRSSAFQVLMWYYQLTGLLLMMPNPLKFIDANAMLLNLIGLVFGSVPVSQAFDFPSVVFCTRAGSTPADIILANLLLYLLWAFVMATLTFKRVWLPVFNWFYAMLNFAPGFWEQYETASEPMAALGTAGKFFAFFLALKWSLAGLTFATFCLCIRRVIVFPFVTAHSAVMWMLHAISCKNSGGNTRPASPQQTPLKVVAYPAEVRGKAWLDFGIAAYSALLSLLVQCTTCINIKGLEIDGHPSVELRWFYDGRVACFSDMGKLSGLWQIAALIGVILLSLLPLMLALYMRRTLSKNAASHNLFEVSALPAYLGQFNSSNKHWFTVM
jgi:hypothetical protein